jgi:predicted methyltransferase
MRCRLLLMMCCFAVWSSAFAVAPRSAADSERDARERPAEVMAFAGIAPGMHVADVFGGAGYYSELLSQAVGASGKVLLVNNPPYARYAREGLESRFADGRLSAVERREMPSDKLGLGESSLDRIVMVMAFHDLYWVAPEDGWPAIDAAAFIAQLHRALKPGGVLLIVDHVAATGSAGRDAQTLHRIEPAFVRSTLETAGFRFDGESDLLRNRDDPLSDSVTAPSVRGQTDRFVHRYLKPNDR